MKEVELKTIIESYLEELCVNIGTRPSGSGTHKRAEKFIADIFEKNGLEVELQKYNCPYWKLNSVSLSSDGKDLKAVPNTFSPPCDVTALPAFAGSLEELELSNIEGRPVVIYGELTEETFFPKNFDLFKIEKQERILKLLEDNRPAAVIAVSHKSENVSPLIEDSDFAIPSITVPLDAGRYLLDHDSKNVSIKIDCENIISSSSNIIGRTKGLTGKRIVVCAHYDTKYGAAGAIDNASGVAAMLAVSELIRSINAGTGVEFLAFGSEDCYYPGDVDYFNRNDGYMNSVTAAINIDGIGVKGSKNSIITLSFTDELSKKTIELVERYEDIVSVEPYFEGDHAFFAFRNIPVISLSSVNIHELTDVITHTKQDTIDKVDPHKIVEIVNFVAEFLSAM